VDPQVPAAAVATASQASWYYLQDDLKVGPVTQDALCDLFRKGALTLQTMVYSDAFSEWTEASSIGALRSLCVMASPVAPPVASDEQQRPSHGRPMAPVDYEDTGEIEGQPIGGWLYLVAIGMLLNPFRQGYVALTLSSMAEHLMTVKNPAAVNLAGSLRLLAMLGGAFAVYQAITAIFFFMRKTYAPAAVILLFLINLALNGLALVLIQPVPGANGASGASGAQAGQGLTWVYMIPSVAVAVLWIPYFLLSERVRATFVR
jgi:hypothetical protein